MRRTLEAIFRHPLQILVLLVLPLGMGLTFALLQPRMYLDEAALWSLRPYGVIGDTGVQTDPTVSPAQTQATALLELLQTRTFALDVASQTSLVSQLSPSTRADPELRDDALQNEISKVQVAAASYSLVVISYQNKDPQVAHDVVKGVVAEFGVQSSAISVAEANRLINVYQNDLATAQTERDKRYAAWVTYVQQHPGVDPRSDPQYLYLQAQVDQEQTDVGAIKAKIDTLHQEVQGTGTDGLFTVVDQPTTRMHPESRLKTLAIFGGAGLAVGLLFAAGYVLILVRRDRTVVSQPEDVRRVAAHAVLLHLPQLDSTTMLLAEPDGAHNGNHNGSHAGGRHSKSGRSGRTQ